MELSLVAGQEKQSLRPVLGLEGRTPTKSRETKNNGGSGLRSEGTSGGCVPQTLSPDVPELSKVGKRFTQQRNHPRLKKSQPIVRRS